MLVFRVCKSFGVGVTFGDLGLWGRILLSSKVSYQKKTKSDSGP